MHLFQQPFADVVRQTGLFVDKSLPHLITGLDSSSRAVFIAQYFQNQPRPLLIVESELKVIEQMVQDLTELLPEVPIFQFSVEDNLAIRFAVSSLDQVAERVNVLDFLASGQPGIILTSVPGIRQPLIPFNQWLAYHIDLAVGDTYPRESLQELLHTLGYRHETMVVSPGEYAVRGGIVDYYPLNADYPIRLDFFDDELDSIRYFNPETQESIENVDAVTLAPAQDVILPLASQQALIPRLQDEFKKAINKMTDQALREQVRTAFTERIEQLNLGEPLPYSGAYLALADPEQTTLVDYLGENGVLIICDYAKLLDRQHHLAEEDQFWLEQEVAQGRLLPQMEMGVPLEESLNQPTIQRLHFSVMQRGLNHLKLASLHNFHYRTMTSYFNQMPLVAEELRQYLQQEYCIQILISRHRERSHFVEMMQDQDVQAIVTQDGPEPLKDRINLIEGHLSHGYELPNEKWVVITEHELFAKLRRPSTRRRASNISNAERIKSYNDLKIGDYVVHADHGIGEYRGIETVELSGVHKDFIIIIYRDQARVLIPVDKIQLIQKYVASEGKKPTLNKLGGTEWAKTKNKVQSTVEDIADELIELYAKRENEKGYAFSADTPEQKEFEEDFPYIETPDQLRSTEEIKQDMEKERPMDRLLVGDVGYGKTEVAMRAIFKAVMDGKQVAFLVPTTILAQQHYNTLIERFNDWPFEIAMMSRFTTTKQQKEILAGLKNGAISIVVGTHRVLSKDVQFQDLGLLIVDEEQRFGVRHKERLKSLKEQVDVLTLTATPIPRTLHMSMIGIRDLSVLETPPSNRFPVQTFVMERNLGAIKSGIEREMLRGGQVFYLYNRVDTIHQKADEIQVLVPDARIAVAHGRMNENELETVLLDFIQGAYDVLVTTTIIETGVDIPNANTLFIDHADQMGLSTLYQLRGRVGRTHRVAYAYLMYDPMKQLTEISEKRLNAIREFTELGSGFKIAMRDLSIRGAGNLLGQQQSGFIDSVGYDMYSQMLSEAIARKQGKGTQQLNTQAELNWQVTIDAYLPDNYIADSRQKISAYKQIQQIDSKESYQLLQDQLIDRYGEFPDAVANLIDIGLIRYYASQIGILSIQQKKNEIRVEFNQSATTYFHGPNIFEALQDVPLKAQIKLDQDQLILQLDITRQPAYRWLGAMITLTQQMYEMVEQEQVNEIG